MQTGVSLNQSASSHTTNQRVCGVLCRANALLCVHTLSRQEVQYLSNASRFVRVLVYSRVSINHFTGVDRHACTRAPRQRSAIIAIVEINRPWTQDSRTSKTNLLLNTSEPLFISSYPGVDSAHVTPTLSYTWSLQVTALASPSALSSPRLRALAGPQRYY